MTQYPVSTTGDWAIYSVQKNLAEVGYFINHNYLVLVDPQGDAVLEMQGLFNGNTFEFHATAGVYLQVKLEVPNQYLSTNATISTTLVAQGSESTILAAFNTAYSAVSSALNANEDLYAGYSYLYGTTYNSNSVWYTAMLSLQASLPGQVTNPISSYVADSSPGDTLNLGTAGSNNSIVTGGGTDTSYPTSPPALPTVDTTYGSPNETIKLAPAGGTGYILGVLNQAQPQLLYYLLSSDATFGTGDNGWSDIATQLDTFSGGAISITGTELQRLNGYLSGGSSTLAAGGIVYVPTSVSTTAPTFTPNQTVIYDKTVGTDGTYYTFVPSLSTGAVQSIILTSGSPVTFDGNTAASAVYVSSTEEDVQLSFNDPIQLGTLALNDSTGAATLTLSDGTPISLSNIEGDTVLTAPTTNTPEQALLSYLSDLGDSTTASALATADYNYQNPTGTAYTVTPSTYGTTSSFFLYENAAPGAVITGVSGNDNTLYTSNPEGTLMDLTQDTISGVPTLYIGGSTTMTGAEFDAFSYIGGGGSITFSTAGTYYLTAVYTGSIITDFIAGAWGGTTLHGNSMGGQTLTASLFGNDHLYAGNGADDILVAGEGVDDLYGGTGGDTFEADNGLAATSIISGSGTGNTLEADGDISQATISGVQTLYLYPEDDDASVALTASQLSGFTSISGEGNVEATTAGTYTLAGITIDDGVILDASQTAANVMLIGNGQNNETLQGGSGTDTLEAGSGSYIALLAGSGTTSLYDGTGADTLEGGSGNDTFYIANATAGSTVVGGTGTNTLVASTAGIGGISISGIQKLDLGYYLSLNASQFSQLSTIDATFGSAAIAANTGGTYDLSNMAVTGNISLSATWSSGGVTLIGNNQASQDLTGSSYTDTLEAGNGNGDILYAGSGTETLDGGSGNDVFDLGSGVDTINGGSGYNWIEVDGVNLASGDTINGGTSGGNTLQTIGTDIDISKATLSNIQTLNVESGVTLNATQLSEFTYVNTSADPATIYAASSGTYDFATASVTGNFNLGASLTGNTTWIADNDGQTLSDGAGEDTLTGGTGNDIFDIQYGVSGTSVSGGGGSDTIDAVYGDLSNLTISGVQTLETASPTEVITLTASQFSAFTTFDNSGSGTATIDVIGTGTHSLTGKTVTGSFSVATVSAAGGGTLTVNGTTTSLTSSAFNGYSTLDNTSTTTAATIQAANVGIYDLATKSVTGNFNLDAAGTSANILLIGNNQTAQTLTAGSGTDILTAGNGGDSLYDGSGVDTLTGGTGNDTFYIANAVIGSSVTGGGGTNTLVQETGDISGVSITGVQNLDIGYYVSLTAGQFTGFSDIDATYGAATISGDTGGTYNLSSESVTGSISLSAAYASGNATLIGNNQSSQTLTGGSYTDTLEAGTGSGDVLAAGSGNTTLIAGTGNDTLTGGGGTNSYEFGSSFGSDTITSAGAGGAAAGTIAFTSSGTTDEKLWFEQSGNNLLIDLLGTTDQITVSNFYSSAGNQVSSVTADGLTLDTQLATLVAAMATYAAANSGFNPQTAASMPTDTTLQSTIAASWHS